MRVLNQVHLYVNKQLLKTVRRYDGRNNQYWSVVGEGTMIDMNATLGGRATTGKMCM